MNVRTSIYRAFLLSTIATVPPCWAQLIDPAAQVRTQSATERRVFNERNPGMSAEIIRPGAIDIRRSEIRHVSPAVIEQIGKVKQSMPSHFGVR